MHSYTKIGMYVWMYVRVINEVSPHFHDHPSMHFLHDEGVQHLCFSKVFRFCTGSSFQVDISFLFTPPFPTHFAFFAVIFFCSLVNINMQIWTPPSAFTPPPFPLAYFFRSYGAWPWLSSLVALSSPLSIGRDGPSYASAFPFVSYNATNVGSVLRRPPTVSLKHPEHRVDREKGNCSPAILDTTSRLGSSFIPK